MSGASLRLENLFLRLGPRVLVPSLTVTIEPGDVVTIMGPSGSGKSSLLAFICGSLDAAFTAGGSIRIGDRELSHLPPEQRRIGILFQDDLLFPHLSIEENLAFGLPARHRDKAGRRAVVEAALAEVGLAGFARRDPSTLSGGQRARVALLRTLLAEPQALLLDEPFGKLDMGMRQRFRRQVLDFAASRRLPTLLVTHDPSDAADAAGRVIAIGTANSITQLSEITIDEILPDSS